ncbi:hypothetical protein AAHA92_06192 [Salvia divinorum]|uniref:Uncharacterized protein n=1 Tax=Salvia divinorum TaxID=28513 RepID=A0ABD1I4W3_SALDI
MRPNFSTVNFSLSTLPSSPIRNIIASCRLRPPIRATTAAASDPITATHHHRLHGVPSSALPFTPPFGGSGVTRRCHLPFAAGAPSSEHAAENPGRTSLQDKPSNHSSGDLNGI